MSFLLVSGKYFLCSECGKYLKVEYDGGAQPTQIGDNNIAYQFELSDQFGQPNAYPDSQGYYLYDLGICGKCVENIVSLEAKLKIDEFDSKLNKVITQKKECIDDILSLVSEYIEKFIFAMNISDVKKIIGGEFDLNFGDKYALPSKRSRQIKAFIDKNSRYFDVYFLNYFLKEGAVLGKISQWERLVSGIRARLHSLKVKIEYIFITKNTSMPENLNDYIQANTTVRVPIAGTPSEIFHYPLKVDEIDLDHLFDIESDVQFDLSKNINLCSLIEKLVNMNH